MEHLFYLVEKLGVIRYGNDPQRSYAERREHLSTLVDVNREPALNWKPGCFSTALRSFEVVLHFAFRDRGRRIETQKVVAILGQKPI